MQKHQKEIVFMSTRKTTAEQIEAAKLKLEQEKARMQGLLQRHKSEERKKRTKRLIERGAIVESLIPESETLTNEQIQIFLTKTIQTEFACRVLREMQTQNPEASVKPQDGTDIAEPPTPHKLAVAAVPTTPATTAKSSTTAPDNATATAPAENRTAAPPS